MKKLHFLFFIQLIIALTGALLINSCSKDDDSDDNDENNNTDIQNQFTDPRDGKVYKTVTIGTQTWMAENLKYTPSNNSWTYNNDAGLAAAYGRLYTWDAALTSCPAGWHLPTVAEWQTLINYLGGDAVAGGKMKETGTTHWTSPNEGATNSSGFTALPGGNCQAGAFADLGTFGMFWTATEFNAGNAYYYAIRNTYTDIYQNNIFKTLGQSVRCVKD